MFLVVCGVNFKVVVIVLNNLGFYGFLVFVNIILLLILDIIKELFELL